MIVFFYLLTLFGLAIYSYSQIDLNLTLLQAPGFLSFQHLMIQLGYYQRPLSALIYTVLLAFLFVFYIFLLKKNPNTRQIIIFICVTCLLALLAYPSFSHDFFNYIFDARIVTHYGQNPYLFKALDFPGDTWTRFMQWTHRTYPYGPFWLVLTVPFSALGLDKFILTLLNFKILFIASYLGSIILIKKILTKINPELALTGVIFFAANPLVIIESLFSPHLDAIMAFFFLLAIYLFVLQKKLLAIIAILLSGGIKFLTLATLPLFFITIPTKKFLEFSLGLLLVILIPVILLREAYPWYFLPAIAVVALLAENKKLVYLAIATSLGLLLRYIVLLYNGQEILLPENILAVAPVLLCALSLIYYRRR